ncbi:metallophosphoesterase [Streptomyces cacaoi]|uniref:metallophosphoesterase n=1 Tax=Streptomyces cacaoi TaxID=1898 RepID=UPI00332CEB98
MTAVVVALAGVLALAALAVVHRYLWRRLVRDVSAPGGWWRRLGTALTVLLPLTTVATLVTSRSGAPFTLQRIVAWPGYLWLACLLYLTLALLAGEALRFVLRRTPWGAARTARPGSGTPTAGTVTAGTVTAAATPATAATAGTAAASGASEPTAGASEAAAGASGPTAGASEAAAGEAVPGGRVAEAVPSRRVFLARTLAVSTAVAGLGTTAVGAYGVLDGPTLKRVTVPLAKLGRRAHGYRIAVVSDIHLGPVLGRAHTRRIVDTVNSAQPDLVAIVGDLVDGTVADLGPAAEPLRELRARDGAFFVTGNHEYFGDVHAWVDHVRELGVHPLENARRELPGFDLAGVNDIQGEEQGEGPDYGKALAGRDPARAAVLLAHQPVMVHEAVDHGVDLQLSGHTHGGQLWPGPYLAALANPTVAGLERYGDTQLYVSRGAGAWGPPVRVGAESDVTVVQLASKQT